MPGVVSSALPSWHTLNSFWAEILWIARLNTTSKYESKYNCISPNPIFWFGKSKRLWVLSVRDNCVIGDVSFKVVVIRRSTTRNQFHVQFSPMCYGIMRAERLTVLTYLVKFALSIFRGRLRHHISVYINPHPPVAARIVYSIFMGLFWLRWNIPFYNNFTRTKQSSRGLYSQNV